METADTRKRELLPRGVQSTLADSKGPALRGSGRSTPRSSQWTPRQDLTHGSRQSHLLEVETQQRLRTQLPCSMSIRTTSSGTTCNCTSSLELEELRLRCSSQCLPTSLAVQYSGRVLTLPMRWFYQLLSQLGSRLWQLIRPAHATRTSQSAGSTIQPTRIGDSGSSIATPPSSPNSATQSRSHSMAHSSKLSKARQ